MKSLMVIVLAATVLMAWPASAADHRRFVPAYFGLVLEGVNVGLVEKFEGGDVEGDVVEAPLAQGENFPRKHIAGVKYSDFSARISTGMAPKVYEWIVASLSMNFERKSGEIQIADFNREVREIREFRDAVITEISFPPSDSSGKDPGFVSIKWSVETVKNKPGSGKLDISGGPKQKLFLPSNFRLQIDGIDASRVAKVDGFTIKQKIARRCGSGGDCAVEPAHIEFPNLALTVPAAGAGPFQEWFQSFVIKGNNDEARHRNGSLVYLDQENQRPLIEIKLSNVGIFSYTQDPARNNGDRIRPSRRIGLFADQFGISFDESVYAKVKDRKAESRMPASGKPKAE